MERRRGIGKKREKKVKVKGEKRAIHVTKASGITELFDPEKIKVSILRSGATAEDAAEVLEKLSTKIYDGIPTYALHRLVRKQLKKIKKEVACKYNLKKAIFRLGPEGYPFEDYVAEIFKAEGYEVSVRQKVSGRCAEHELDVVLFSKGKSKKYFAECKFRNSQDQYIKIKDALCTYARLIDLNEGGVGFDSAWLITNNRFSEEVIKYGKCVELELLSWKYPEGEGLEARIEKHKLYPVTVLSGVNQKLWERFYSERILLLRDLDSIVADS